MFDIGFTEILVIAVIALFVIGPERLPETVREIALWIGRLKRSLRDTRMELEQQIGAEEIRRTLHNENVLKNLQDVKRDVEDTFNKDIGLDPDDDLNLPPHDPNNDLDDEAEAVQSLATEQPASSEQSYELDQEQEQDQDQAPPESSGDSEHQAEADAASEPDKKP